MTICTHCDVIIKSNQEKIQKIFSQDTNASASEFVENIESMFVKD